MAGCRIQPEASDSFRISFQHLSDTLYRHGLDYFFECLVWLASVFNGSEHFSCEFWNN